MDALSPSFGLVAKAGRIELFGSVAGSFETTDHIRTREPRRWLWRAQSKSGTPAGNDRCKQGCVARVGQCRSRYCSFRSSLTDELVPFEVPSDPGRTYYRNAGKSTHTGAEASLYARLGQAGTVRVAYTRVNARFDEYESDGTDHSGNRVPGLAPNRFDAILSGSMGSGFAELRGLYQGELPVDDAGEHSSPGYFLTDLRLGLSQLGAGRTKFSPFIAVANVFDHRYNSSVVVNAFGRRFFEPGPGRTFTVGMGVALGG